MLNRWRSKKKRVKEIQDEMLSATPPQPPKECQHKYKDFSWYLINSYDGTGYFHCEIVEPYVCVYCKKRINKTLEEYQRHHFSANEAIEFVEKLHEQFPDKIKPKAVVEDEINDFILVDRDFLKVYDYINNNGTLPEIKLKL